MTAVRVLLVDDQALFREGLHTLLSLHSDITVVGEAGNGEEALHLSRNLQPDVVLVDLRMPVLDGVTATRRLAADSPRSRVLILTTFDDDDYLFEGLRAGAAGYLLKDTPSEKLGEAVRTVARGESFLQPSVAAKVVAEFARLAERAPRADAALAEPLSEREVEVLRLVTRGASNREISEQLVIAEGTVKNHVTNILGKLGVRDHTQAALKAKDLGLV